jgi:hypothetical protein
MTQKTWLLLCLIAPFFSISQETNKNHEVVFNAFSKYYHLDTESIDLHLNKNFYINDESIYFKGTIIHKKTGKLNFETTNIQVTLLNEEFEKITSNLFYAEKGFFTGQLTLNSSYKPGNYYVHVYTNYMNNNENDESTLIPIQIADNKTNIFEKKASLLENWKIETISEGGFFLNAAVNTIGVHIMNDFGNGEKIEDILVIDSKNSIVNKFSTNNEGYGKFLMRNYLDTPYKLSITKDDKTIEFVLPKTEEEGININVTKKEDKTIIKLITNKKTLDKISKNSYTILLQNNETVKLTDFKFGNNLIKFLNINNDSIKKGINIIRLLDADLNLISERTFYNDKAEDENILLNKVIVSNDSIVVTGKITRNLTANLSVSVLPNKSLSNLNENSNFINLKINNQLINKLSNHSFYFRNDTDPNYEALDLFLLHETKSKENFKSIINTIPLSIYPFENGLTIYGKINDEISENELKKIKICLFSTNGTLEYVDLNEKKEFEFKNIYATKSSAFYIKTLKNDKEQPNFGQVVTIKNEKIGFIKNINYKGKVNMYYLINENDSVSTKIINLKKNNLIVEVSKIDNRKPFTTTDALYFDLKEVNVKGQLEENKLKNLNYHNNNSLTRGVKITETIENAFQDVLTFIATHGYIVKIEAGVSVSITTRRPTTLTGTSSPLVFYNDIRIDDFSFFLNMDLENIDEIYISQLGYGMGIGGNNGSIRIYEKKEIAGKKKYNGPKPNQLLIKNGFTENEKFSNDKNIDYSSDYFKRFGTIQWIPNITVSKNGKFSFKIPNTSLDTLFFNIQGIDEQGNLYYENKTMKIN